MDDRQNAVAESGRAGEWNADVSAAPLLGALCGSAEQGPRPEAQCRRMEVAHFTVCCNLLTSCCRHCRALSYLPATSAAIASHSDGSPRAQVYNSPSIPPAVLGEVTAA